MQAIQNFPGIAAAQAEPNARSAFLRKVGAITALGLTISTVVGGLSAVGLMYALAVVPFLGSSMGQMIVIFGAFGLAQYVAPGIVRQAGPTKWAGFLLGTVAQGVAMGWLFLAAAFAGMELTGSPFTLIGQAFGLVGLLTLGMFTWLMTGPKNLSMVQGAVAMLSLPMLALMVISFIFPIGGPLGILLTAVFVVVSAGGVLVQLNKVMHTYPTNAPVPAGYSVTIGLLVLYWNVLSLLMRLRSR